MTKSHLGLNAPFGDSRAQSRCCPLKKSPKILVHSIKDISTPHCGSLNIKLWIFKLESAEITRKNSRKIHRYQQHILLRNEFQRIVSKSRILLKSQERQQPSASKNYIFRCNNSNTFFLYFRWADVTTFEKLLSHFSNFLLLYLIQPFFRITSL